MVSGKSMSDRSGGRVEIVTRGWDLPGEAGDFYPWDLPRDWRLTFFSNAFPAVLVPAALWIPASSRRLRDWADDVHDGFRFYLELPAACDPADGLRNAAEALGDRLAGVVGSTDPAPGSGILFLRWHENPSAVDSAPSAVSCPVESYGRDLRRARAWLETFVHRLAGSSGLVVLDGAEADATALRRWLDMAWLLGFA
jgi:hypothetical protein